MPTTALNVLGNALAPLVIARWEQRTTERQARLDGTPLA
jgi:proton glutamate symport protein